MIGSLADGLTSFYGGFVIFSVVGFMAKEANTTMEKVATQGALYCCTDITDIVCLLVFQRCCSTILFHFYLIFNFLFIFPRREAGIAQWLEYRPRDRIGSRV